MEEIYEQKWNNGKEPKEFQRFYWNGWWICIVTALLTNPMGVAGAALATVLSQLVSGLLNMFWLLCRTDLLKQSRDAMAVSMAHIKELSIVGFPMGFEYSVSAIGAVIMQGAINALGSIAVAGQTAGEKIRQMFTLPMESVGMGYSTHAVLSGVGELLGRALGGFLAIKWLGFFGICIANPLAWGFALIYCSVLVVIFLRRRLQAFQ